MNDPSNTRRKLLQGSLAAPLVLTVSSASAQAVSSFTQCIESTAASRLRDSERIIQSTDQWFRSPITVYKYSRGSVSKKGGTDDVWVYRARSGIYRKIADNSEFQTSGYAQTATATRNQLVYFHADGTPAGAGWEKDSGGFAVTASCGGSFAVARG